MERDVLSAPRSYRVIIPAKLKRRMRRLLQPRELRRVLQRIAALEQDPRPRRVEKLTADRDERYRVRQGDWRIIYTIDDRNRTVLIDDVTRRNEATYGR